MLTMRLQRIGRRNDPSFRMIVIDSHRGPRSGNQVDFVGTYNPKSGAVSMDVEKIKPWLSKGVQPSDTVYNMLVTKKIIEGKKRNVLPRKSPIISEEAKQAAEAAAASRETSAETPAETATEETVEAKAE